MHCFCFLVNYRNWHEIASCLSKSSPHFRPYKKLIDFESSRKDAGRWLNNCETWTDGPTRVVVCLFGQAVTKTEEEAAWKMHDDSWCLRFAGGYKWHIPKNWQDITKYRAACVAQCQQISTRSYTCVPDTSRVPALTNHDPIHFATMWEMRSPVQFQMTCI